MTKIELINKWLLLSSSLFLFISFAHSQSLPNQDLKLTAGDAIRIIIYDGNIVPDQNRFISQFHNQEFILDGNGEIRLGSLGMMRIAGLTEREITLQLTEKFKAYAKEPNVIVIPLIRLVMRGEFGRPGMYRFPLTTSFWDVIERAGGLEETFSIENMYIYRNGELVYKNFEKAYYQASSLKELGIKSGDEIVVPRINRISFISMLRYFQFASSIIILYFTVTNRPK